MMKKTLIATATAGLIAVGAMVGTTSTASAAGVYLFGGSGWGVGIGGPGYGPHRSHQECRPVFKTVHWRDNQGHRHSKQVVVRQECHWTYGPSWHQRDPNPGRGWRN